jgi:selenocysteine lyase/cysteine desulfurase
MTRPPAVQRYVRRAARVAVDVRARFPAVDRRERGVAIACFDAPGRHAGSSGVAGPLPGCLTRHNTTQRRTGRSLSASKPTTSLAPRRATTAFLKASPDEIAFGPKVTARIFHRARAFYRPRSAGDAIVVTHPDHRARTDP